MFNKLILGLATLGLAATAAPAAAQTRFELTVRSGHPEYTQRDRFYRKHYFNNRNFRHYPRCKRWEVAVQNPYRPGRYVCMPTRQYNDFQRWYRPY